MAAPTTESAVPAADVSLTGTIRVAVPQRGLRQDLRAAGIVWRREWIRFRTDRLRAITSLIQPVLFLFILGTGLGGATVATFQGIIVLALAGLAGVPYNPILILTLIGELLLLSFTLTAFGVMMAARIKQFQAFMALTQMLVMPLFFLSGALYPLTGLPAWLAVLTRIDPLTYIVGPMRRAVFNHLNISPAELHTLAPGISWGGWTVPLGLSLGIVAIMGLIMVSVAIAEFSKTE